MRFNKLTLAAGAALAAVCILGGQVAQAAVATPIEVIGVKTRVESQNGTSRGDFDLGAGVPVRLGEQVKVSLVGTAMINGAGREVPIDARFEVAAGGNNIGILRTGPNWVLISVNGGAGNALAQLGWTATGSYKMKPAFSSGRITFKIGDATPAAGGGQAPGQGQAPGDVPQGYQQSRWQQAMAANATLYRAILRTEPSGSEARANADRIYQQGYGGLLTVATTLARTAEDQGQGRSRAERGYQERDIERLGGLYRDLLRRQQSDQQLWAQDRGFRDNVQALHEKGLPAAVASIVNSDEFRANNPVAQTSGR